MDFKKIVEILQGTIHPDTRESAEQQLNEIHKIIGFAPHLLQVVMVDEVQFPVRQAGVIYLKNMIVQFWQEREPDPKADPREVLFSIHENDRALIRENIIEAIIRAPELVRVQLAVCLRNILKHDYPGRWTGIVQKTIHVLQSKDLNAWYGALIGVYQLVKNYEYKKPNEREPLNHAIKFIQPLMYDCVMLLKHDQSEAAMHMKKQILKIFYALTQYFLPLDLINEEIFTKWMKVFQEIVEAEIPPETSQVLVDDRPELIWWKTKKWALHILARMFERYGSPGNVIKDYNKFSEWYLKTFSPQILTTLLKVLDQYRQQQYISPRVLQQSLNYVNTGVKHAKSWNIMKGHMQILIQDIIFPLMCHTDEDDELWNDDPYEYIRMKFDVFEDFISPVTAAQTVLQSAASKRKEVLQKTMGFCMNVLTQPGVGPRQKDGALHMVGSMAELLLKKKMYKDRMEHMLVSHVLPEFKSEHGYMRARANYVIHTFSEVRFKNDKNLQSALDLTRQSLVLDKEMPVKVEAAIALQMLITSNEKAKDYIQPHVKEVIEALLIVIRETENDDLTNVMQKLICTYCDEVTTIAVDITTHLAATFTQVVDGDDPSDDKAITAMGILNTIETLLNVMEDHKEIMLQLEGIVLQVVRVILQQQVIDFYEEVLSLIFSMTCTHISPPLWQVFPMVYEMFSNDGFDYFLEMMPALHNYITVDPQTFLSNTVYIESIFNMCKKIISEESDGGEDAECHAMKLLEVIVIQYKGRIDQCIPSFVTLAMERLMRNIKTSELQQMCLQVIVGALYYDPTILLQTLEKVVVPTTGEPALLWFVKMWLQYTDCFLGLHDRKVCVLGLLALLELPNRPEAVSASAQHYLPALIMLFKGLQRVYDYRISVENEDSDDEDEDDDEFDEVLESDEDEIDEDGAEYMEKLEKSLEGKPEIDEDEAYEETALEGYNTTLDDEETTVDEYEQFKQVMQNLQVRDPEWYNALTNALTEEHRNDLQQVILYSDQRKLALESKRIERSGGYKFDSTAIPTSFHFGNS
ncbi:importin-7-like [Antedon mediterranea]|uniref:importin-7-like n=1 Tax=Antedon mediterranea TaxID=105859 RepID=UPI003AF4E270